METNRRDGFKKIEQVLREYKLENPKINI